MLAQLLGTTLQVNTTEFAPLAADLQSDGALGSGTVGAPLLVESVIVNFASVTVIVEALYASIVSTVGVLMTTDDGQVGVVEIERSPTLAILRVDVSLNCAFLLAGLPAARVEHLSWFVPVV